MGTLQIKDMSTQRSFQSTYMHSCYLSLCELKHDYPYISPTYGALIYVMQFRHYHLKVQANPKNNSIKNHLWEKRDYPMSFFKDSHLGNFSEFEKTFLFWVGMNM